MKLPKFESEEGKIYCYGLLALFVAIYLYPFFRPWDSISEDGDFQRLYYFYAEIRKSLLVFHELPLWSPYTAGGFFEYSHPFFPLLDPLLLGVLVFGEVIGIKLKIAALYLLLVWGEFYLLRERFYKSNWVCLVLSALLFSCRIFLSYVAGGGIPNLSYAAFPFFWGFFLHSPRRPRYQILSALILVWILFNGGQVFFAAWIFMFFFSLLSLFAAPASTEFKRTDYLSSVLTITVMALGLGLVKLLPILNSIPLDSVSVGGFATLRSTAFAGPSQVLAFLTSNADFFGASLELKSFTHNAIFMGYFTGIFGIVSLLVFYRSYWRYLILGVIFLLFLSTGHIVIDPFQWLWHLPVWHSFRTPLYFAFFIPFILIIPLGSLLLRLTRIKNRPWRAALITALIALSFYPQLWQNYMLAQRVFSSRAIYLQNFFAGRTAAEDFFQVSFPVLPKFFHDPKTGKSWDYLFPPGFSPYRLFRQNVGVINAHLEFYLPTFTAPRYYLTIHFSPALVIKQVKNPLYRGEAYLLLSDGAVNKLHFGFSQIRAQVQTNSPNLLIFNQNYAAGWRSQSGKVVDYQGLLALRLDRPTCKTVILRFLPMSLLLGVLGSLLCGLGMLVWWRRNPAPVKIK